MLKYIACEIGNLKQYLVVCSFLNANAKETKTYLSIELIISVYITLDINMHNK